MVLGAMALTRSLPAFTFLVLLVGLTAGSVAPSLQAWMGDAAPAGRLVRSLSRFNVAWSMGLLAGTVGSGALFTLHPSVPFAAAAGVALVIALVVARVPAARAGQPAPAAPGSDDGHPAHAAAFFQRSGWASVFAAFFIFGGIQSLFPKVGVDGGLSPLGISLLLGSISLARTATFYLLGRTGWWLYRETVLIGSLIAGGLALVVSVFDPNPLLWFVAFAVVGMMQGMCFTSSLYYSLHAPGPRGRRSGVNEFALSAGATAGALIAGAVSQALGPRVHFLPGTLLAVVVAGAIWLAARVARGAPAEQAAG